MPGRNSKTTTTTPAPPAAGAASAPDAADLRAQLQARERELAIIQTIQQGVAGQLGLQAVVDLVGDPLAAAFNAGDLSIRWWEPEAGTVQML